MRKYDALTLSFDEIGRSPASPSTIRSCDTRRKWKAAAGALRKFR